MGDHYIPQFYLKAFSQNYGKRIWVYDKKNIYKIPTQVKSIANITKFYSREVEQYLANSIEGPANSVLKKIRNFKIINMSEKCVFSKYMAVMMKRVPEGLNQLKRLAPSISKKLSSEISEELRHESLESREKQALLGKYRKILENYSTDPPKEAWLKVLPPETTPQVFYAFNNMIWRFLVSNSKSEFLTSDNPLFYFTSIGIGKFESEVLFPISKNIALWATWKEHFPIGYINVKSQVVKEMNRRTASYATRYIFKSKDEDWVLPFVIKKRRKLHLYQ